MRANIDVSVGITLDNVSQLDKALKILAGSDVLVGVPEAKSSRKNSKAVTNAVLAFVHNNGSPINNIPARPTLEPGILDAHEAETKYMQQAANAVLDGDTEKLQSCLEACGTVAVSAVKKRIRSNTPPPLKPATIAARRRRGVQRTNTLVDTSAYLNAHTYVVRKGN